MSTSSIFDDKLSRNVDHFVPVPRRVLIDDLANEGALDEVGREDLRKLASMLAHVFHFSFHREIQSLKRDYWPFDPDVDDPSREALLGDERRDKSHAMAERFKYVLRRANYREVEQEELNELLAEATPWALRLQVDFEQFEHFCFYYRGIGEEEREYRSLATFFRKRSQRVPVFQRLAMLVHFKVDAELPPGIDSRFIYLKLFKNIPRADLEMLFPNTVPQMRLMDKIKVITPLVSGIGTTVWKILAAVTLGFYAMMTLTVGLIIYAVKSLLGYFRLKESYQGTLVTNLYFNSLDNNRGVLHHVVDQAEEEEVKEAVLAYYYLLTDPRTRVNEPALDRHIEGWLKRRYGVATNFEAPDALAKLERLSLLERRPDDSLDVPSLKVALRRLDEAWDAYFDYADDPEYASSEACADDAEGTTTRDETAPREP